MSNNELGLWGVLLSQRSIGFRRLLGDYPICFLSISQCHVDERTPVAFQREMPGGFLRFFLSRRKQRQRGASRPFSEGWNALIKTKIRCLDRSTRRGTVVRSKAGNNRELCAIADSGNRLGVPLVSSEVPRDLMSCTRLVMPSLSLYEP